MIKIVDALLFILIRLTIYLEDWERKKQKHEQNQSIKDLEANPVDWFNSHFGGVQPKTDQTPTATEADTESNPPR